MQPRRYISLSLAAGAGALAAAATGTHRPNILVCMADDAGHMGAYGTPWVHTPAFDSIASRGILFRNAFTCNSKSAPSRACFITGRNSWQLREAANHWPAFPADIRSFPEALKNSGYYTGYTGKGWGPGIAQNADGSERELTGKKFNSRKLKPATTGINKINYAANFGEYLKGWDHKSPLCFWYGAREPHRGYEYGSSARFGKHPADIDSVPAYWPDNETVRTDMLDYAVEIEHFDRHLGRIIEMLDSVGELENTIVIVTSDHGMPFPRCKGQEYLASCHVPLAIMWPCGIKNPGRATDSLVSLTDIAPTLMEAVGLTEAETGMEPMSGRSLFPILNDTAAGIRPYLLLGRERHDPGRPDDQGYPIRGIIRDNLLYLRNYEPSRWPAGNPETGYMDVDGSPTKTEIIRARRNPATHYLWELSMGLRPEEELYDLSRDADCITNLASDPAYAARLKALRAEMETRLRAEGDPRMEGRGDIFDRYPNKCESHQFYNRVKAGENPPHKWINDSDFDNYGQK